MNSGKDGLKNYHFVIFVNLCCLHLDFKVYQQVALYSLSWETSLVAPVTILAASICIFPVCLPDILFNYTKQHLHSLK